MRSTRSGGRSPTWARAAGSGAPASRHAGAGYTHLQRAQPVRLAHHLLAYVQMLVRDQRRFGRGPRGLPGRIAAWCGRLSGSGSRSIAADGDRVGSRARAPTASTASRRGMPCRLSARCVHPVRACLAPRRGAGAVGERGGRLRRALGRVHLRFIHAPQKKNPDAAELARAKASRVIADYAACRDCWQASARPTTRTCRRTSTSCSTPSTPWTCCCRLSPECRPRPISRGSHGRRVPGRVPRRDRSRRLLVRAGWPFRRAHEAVGQWCGLSGPRVGLPRPPRTRSLRQAWTTSVCRT